MEASIQERTYRMRCPNCRKLFSVEARHLSDSSKPTTFSCDSCNQLFGALAPTDSELDSVGTIALETPQVIARPTREIQGHLAHLSFRNKASEDGAFNEEAIREAEIELEYHAIRIEEPEERATLIPVPIVLGRAPKTEVRECPKCGSKTSKGANECRSCGVVFERYKPDSEERFNNEVQLAGRIELVHLWDSISGDLHNKEAHESFVQACYEAGSLPFASHKYSSILDGAPDLEIPRLMRNRIIGLASQNFERSTIEMERTFPLPSFNSFILLLGTLTIGLGLGLPKAGDLIGVGLMMIVVAFGLRFFLRRAK